MGRETLATERTLVLHEMVETSERRELDTTSLETTGSLLAKDMTTGDGMGHVHASGVTFEADVACRVGTEHEHDRGRERDWLRTLSSVKNKGRVTDIRNGAAIQPGQVRVLT